jgi:hypothetical protein
MRIQGTFDSTDNTWKDDSGNNLTFTQFVTQGYIAKRKEILILLPYQQNDNFIMGHRRGVKNPFINICIV